MQSAKQGRRISCVSAIFRGDVTTSLEWKRMFATGFSKCFPSGKVGKVIGKGKSGKNAGTNGLKEEEEKKPPRKKRSHPYLKTTRFVLYSTLTFRGLERSGNFFAFSNLRTDVKQNRPVLIVFISSLGSQFLGNLWRPLSER